jgi:glutathione S-transferase
MDLSDEGAAMRLYHHPLSSNSRRAALAAAHLGLPAELIKIDLERGEQRSPEFLALNPNGMVPVLEDNGFILTESHAIMLYLADKTRDHAAYPEDARARADINRWVFWNAQHFQPTVSIFVWENLIKGMIGQGAADPAQLRRGEDLLDRYAPVLDEHLTSRRWVCGDSVTLADLALGATLLAAAPANVPLAPYRHLLAWFARVQALEAWKETAS